jgi:hypothetical protein
MQEEKNVQIDICDLLFRKALLEKELVDYLKSQGYIFYYPAWGCPDTQAWAVHPDYYKGWLTRREWKTYPSWVAVKIDN